VLVIEAGLNSGTLITARKAAEQGRDVFALPGSLHNPLAKGCHRLIREGATLVETTADIMQEMGPVATELHMEIRNQLDQLENADKPPTRTQHEILDDADYAKLWSVLGFDPKTMDAIIGETGLGASEVSSMLLILELKGMVRKQGSGRFFRA
jgi:DNA processing protein